MPIFDQGYQHWSGTLSGHSLRWLTITRHGVRVCMKNIFLRIVVLASWVPAAALAGLLCFWGLLEQKSPLIASITSWISMMLPADMAADPRHFRIEVWTVCFDYFLWIEIYISMVVVLLVGPSLISQDLRFNALPLYFSRPLRRIDYFIGKMGVIAWFLGLVVVFPSLLAYGLGMLFSLDLTIIRDTFVLLLACLAYGAIVVLSAGALMLALSSLSRNSRYVALFWVSLWFVGGVVGTTLNVVSAKQRELKHQELYREAAMTQDQRREPPRTREEAMAQQKEQQDRFKSVNEKIMAYETEVAESNWQWLPSYTANLSRVGGQLLGTQAAWQKFSLLLPENERGEFLYILEGPIYPWYWSAGVLAVLFGLSVCILNFRIRSLDRLK